MDQNEKFSFFRSEVERIFAWLGEHGFARCEAYDEKTKSVYSTIVYCGNNLGLQISYDVRDDYVSVDIIQCLNGKPSGRQCDVVEILVRKMKVSGEIPDVSAGSSEGLGNITRRLERYSQYIKRKGFVILRDNLNLFDDSVAKHLEQKRRQLDDAWNSGDYANIVQVYERHRETLGKVDAKRLSYAKGKLLRGGT